MKLVRQEAELIDHGEKEEPSDRINRIDRIFPALRMRAGKALESQLVQPLALSGVAKVGAASRRDLLP